MTIAKRLKRRDNIGIRSAPGFTADFAVSDARNPTGRMAASASNIRISFARVSLRMYGVIVAVAKSHAAKRSRNRGYIAS
jgi:hypothetical protein